MRIKISFGRCDIQGGTWVYAKFIMEDFDFLTSWFETKPYRSKYVSTDALFKNKFGSKT